MEKHYTYIITGAGCSGLTLAWKLKDVLKPGETVLLIDRTCKDENNRTFSFWADKSYTNGMLFHEWEKMVVMDSSNNFDLEITPYKYCMIQSGDYADAILTELKKNSSFELLKASVIDIKTLGTSGVVTTSKGIISANWVFNSCYPNLKEIAFTGRINLIQQFYGFTIETEKDCFTPGELSFMDFRTNQSHGTTFGYVLPFSSKTALVEFVAISKDYWQMASIKEELEDYIENTLKTGSYKIISKESGWLPMTDSKLNPYFGERVINIGIVGGALKASTGYSFTNTQMQAERLIRSIKTKGYPINNNPFFKKRFRLYDRTFLLLLQKYPQKGHELFISLFKHNKANKILKFLDNQTTLFEELRIFSTVNLKRYIPTILQCLFADLHQKKTAFKKAVYQSA